MSFQYSLRFWTHSSAWIRSCLGCCWALLSLHRKSKQTWNSPRSTRSLLIFSRPLNQSRSNRRTHQSQSEKWKIYDPHPWIGGTYATYGNTARRRRVHVFRECQCHIERTRARKVHSACKSQTIIWTEKGRQQQKNKFRKTNIMTGSRF